MVSIGFISMCGILFRGFETICARVLTTFRREPCPHIPYEWIITTVRPGSQKVKCHFTDF